MVGTWLGEIRSCSCLAVLPDSAWVLLNKIYQPFFTSLYKQRDRLTKDVCVYAGEEPGGAAVAEGGGADVCGRDAFGRAVPLVPADGGEGFVDVEEDGRQPSVAGWEYREED